MALWKETELFDTLKEKLQNITNIGWDSGKIKLVIVTGEIVCDHDWVFVDQGTNEFLLEWNEPWPKAWMGCLRQKRPS